MIGRVRDGIKVENFTPGSLSKEDINLAAAGACAVVGMGLSAANAVILLVVRACLARTAHDGLFVSQVKESAGIPGQAAGTLQSLPAQSRACVCPLRLGVISALLPRSWSGCKEDSAGRICSDLCAIHRHVS
jgi:hypothetical protein